MAFREPVLTDVRTIAALEAAHRALDDEDGLEAEVVYREALERLLRLHATPTGSPLRSAGAPARVARAREFLSEHVADDVALDDLVAAAGLSRYHLIRAFRQEYGLTPFAFHRRQRVERAREVLRRGGSLASAVAAARFADQSHLGRVFTATFGVTPGEYRRCFETPSRSARRASRLTAFGE